MRYLAAAIVILAGALAVGLGAVSETATYRSDQAQSLGLALVLGGAAIFIYDLVQERRANKSGPPE